MLENGALCLYNIVSGSMEIGLDSFSVGQASGALSSICHGEERGKESSTNGICPAMGSVLHAFYLLVPTW